MINNIDENGILFTSFAKWLDTADSGMHAGLEDDAVDTRDTIEMFLDRPEVKIIEDVTDGDLRRVEAYTSNPAFKNTMEHLLLMTDGTWTVVIAS